MCGEVGGHGCDHFPVFGGVKQVVHLVGVVLAIKEYGVVVLYIGEFVIGGEYAGSVRVVVDITDVVPFGFFAAQECRCVSPVFAATGFKSHEGQDGGHKIDGADQAIYSRSSRDFLGPAD